MSAPGSIVVDPESGQDAAQDLDAAAAPMDADDIVSATEPRDAGSAFGAMDARIADAAAVPDATLPPDISASDADRPTDAASVHAEAGQAACSLLGSFSAEVNFDVQWRATTLSGVLPVLAAGTGRIRFIVRLDSEQEQGDLTRAKLHACHGALPDFAASWLVGEVYSAHIPNVAWEQPTMPAFDLNWKLPCRQPGCGMSSDMVMVTLGARANAQDIWPGSKGPIGQIVPADHDNDTLPGITYITRGPDERSPSGRAYDRPPVTWTLSTRALSVQLAIQVRGRVQASLASCDAFAGQLSEGAVEARTIACRTRREAGAPELPCTQEQGAFIDENLPNWAVTGGSVRARRVAPNADCNAVRAVWQ